MIGIHVYSREIDTYNDTHQNHTEIYGEYKFTLSYHQQYSKEVYCSYDNYLIYVDGWIFNYSYEQQAKKILELYKEIGDDFIYELNGQFNILIVNKSDNTFKIFNDIYSFRKHYYCLTNKSLLFSSDIDYIQNSTVLKTINIEHIKKNINLPRFIDINETFINEINQFSPCSIINSDLKLKKYSYEKIEKKYTSSLTSEPTEFLKKIKKRLKNIHKLENILLLISGGLDSRFVLEIFNEINFNVKTATYGNIISDEVQIAKNVAYSNNIEHFSYNLKAKDFICDSKQYIKQTNGLDIFVQSSVYKFYENLKEHYKISDFIIDTGFALDVFLGGTYISGTERFQNEVKTSTIDFSINDNNKFSTINRVFSTLAIRQSAHREFYEDRYSMYDYEIYFLMKNLPQEKIIDYKYYYKLCQLQIKNSFDIPLQSIMFDLSLDFKYWKEAEKIQQQKEEFTLNYFQKKRKALYHNRYYSDFDMWIRADKDWINLVNRLFTENESIISKYFIENKIIIQTINEHMSGEKSHLRNLIKWISLELFFQENKNNVNFGEKYE